jgi:hypothetical protein
MKIEKPQRLEHMRSTQITTINLIENWNCTRSGSFKRTITKPATNSAAIFGFKKLQRLRQPKDTTAESLLKARRSALEIAPSLNEWLMPSTKHVLTGDQTPK